MLESINELICHNRSNYGSPTALSVSFSHIAIGFTHGSCLVFERETQKMVNLIEPKEGDFLVFYF